jgi:hypothetical protein
MFRDSLSLSLYLLSHFHRSLFRKKILDGYATGFYILWVVDSPRSTIKRNVKRHREKKGSIPPHTRFLTLFSCGVKHKKKKKRRNRNKDSRGGGYRKRKKEMREVLCSNKSWGSAFFFPSSFQEQSQTTHL